MKTASLVSALCLTLLASNLELAAQTPPPATENKKVTLGIGEIKSKVPGQPAETFGTMLETQLVKTNKFDIIERARLDQILGEKGLSVAGIAEGTGKLSGVSGVNYLVYGSITKLGSTGQNVAVRGFALSTSKTEMAIDLRVVDANTGKMLYADTVEETMDGHSSISMPGFGNSQGGGTDALSDLERLTAKAITDRITTTIYPIKVIAVQSDGTIVVNYGDSVLTVGDQLKIFELGESFKDPDTGEVLGAEEKQVGLLQVTEVTAKFSKAKVLSGVTPKVGNIAKRLSSVATDQAQPKRNNNKLP